MIRLQVRRLLNFVVRSKFDFVTAQKLLSSVSISIVLNLLLFLVFAVPLGALTVKTEFFECQHPVINLLFFFYRVFFGQH